MREHLAHNFLGQRCTSGETLELDAREVETVLHAHDVALEFAPAIGVGRELVVGAK
jgi:hypothetical protein